MAIFCTWDVFHYIFRESVSGLPVHAGWSLIKDGPLSERQRNVNKMVLDLPHYWTDNTFDSLSMEGAQDDIERHKPRVLFIGLGETDEWGHARRYDLYLDAACNGDRYLADLWRTIQEMPEYKDKTTLILTCDHGRGSTPVDWTDHGQKVPGKFAGIYNVPLTKMKHRLSCDFHLHGLVIKMSAKWTVGSPKHRTCS